VPVDWKDSLKHEVVRVMNTIALRMAVRSIVELLEVVGTRYT
jgi:ABC-type uncharacterized transport system involved in gliding motility auxiliary subunit